MSFEHPKEFMKLKRYHIWLTANGHVLSAVRDFGKWINADNAEQEFAVLRSENATLKASNDVLQINMQSLAKRSDNYLEAKERVEVLEAKLAQVKDAIDYSKWCLCSGGIGDPICGWCRDMPGRVRAILSDTRPALAVVEGFSPVVIGGKPWTEKVSIEIHNKKHHKKHKPVTVVVFGGQA